MNTALPSLIQKKTAEMIDEEIRLFITSAYARTKDLLLDKKEHLYKLADVLLDKEILFQSNLEELLGMRQWQEREPEAETIEEKKQEEKEAGHSSGKEGHKTEANNHTPEHKDAEPDHREGISLAPDLPAENLGA